MSLSKSEQRAIVRADYERRLQRDISEYLAIHGRPADKPAASDALPNHARIFAASDITMRVPHKRYGTHTVGVATGTEETSDGTPTVLCKFADGSTEIRPVSSFRKASKDRARRVVTAAQSVPEMAQAKYPVHILTGE